LLEPHRFILIGSAMIALARVSPAVASNDLPPPPSWTARELGIDSGLLRATGRDPNSAEVVFSREFVFDAASWVRLTLDGSMLPGRPGSGREAWLFMTTPQGDVQAFNAEHLRQWSGSSAYFNGGRVRVDLVMYPGDQAARLVIPSVMLGDARPTVPPERTICGTTDDRTLSSDPRVARIMPVGCTAWMINDANRMFLTAGHCGTSAASVIQFNVPLSNDAGTPIFPPPQDQYAVDPLSIQWAQTALGDDWGYFGVYPNPNTGLTPAQAQGQFFTLATAAPAPTAGAQARVTGFGTVAAPVPLSWNYAQKTGVGPYTSLSGNAVSYAMDTTGGNSGSPVILESTGQAIGIHTSGGCNATNGANSGTAVQSPKLRSALAVPKGVCSTGASGTPSGPLFGIGDAANNLGTFHRATGLFSRLSAPASAPVALAYRSQDDRFYAIDASQRLVIIDPATGVGVTGPTISATGAPITDLAHDSRADRFVGVANATGQFVTINPANGSATAFGAPVGGNIVGIAILTATGQTFALDASPVNLGGPRLWTVNRLTGAITLIGPLGAGLSTVAGLAWNDDQQSLITIDTVANQLVRINASNGAATVIGPTNAIWPASKGGIAYRRIERVCFGDLNLDRACNLVDLSLLLSQYGRNVTPGLSGDLNADGVVGTKDVTAILAAFGCQQTEQP
jgi:V8-like Glu-specific endopeptidase